MECCKCINKASVVVRSKTTILNLCLDCYRILEERVELIRIDPVVGMGATLHIGSDCYAYTVINIISDFKIEIQEDQVNKAKNYNYYFNQVYDYSPNPLGVKLIFTKRKDGAWRQQGISKTRGSVLVLGRREFYQDPSF